MVAEFWLQKVREGNCF